MGPDSPSATAACAVAVMSILTTEGVTRLRVSAKLLGKRPSRSMGLESSVMLGADVAWVALDSRV